MGYLRAFITVMVLAHHSVLAYHPFAPAPLASLVAQPRWWQAFPIVDSKRWVGFGLFVSFNDIFMMSLMFFISGLFVWKSLRFARRRVKAFDSLCDNAYGMYLIHYPCVIWLQYALLKAQFPAVAKATVVFCVTCAVSWAATSALRGVPGVARLI